MTRNYRKLTSSSAKATVGNRDSTTSDQIDAIEVKEVIEFDISGSIDFLVENKWVL